MQLATAALQTGTIVYEEGFEPGAVAWPHPTACVAGLALGTAVVIAGIVYFVGAPVTMPATAVGLIVIGGSLYFVNPATASAHQVIPADCSPVDGPSCDTGVLSAETYCLTYNQTWADWCCPQGQEGTGVCRLEQQRCRLKTSTDAGVMPSYSDQADAGGDDGAVTGQDAGGALPNPE